MTTVQHLYTMESKMDKDKLNNEDYFKAYLSEYFSEDGIRGVNRIELLKSKIWDLHIKVSERIDPTKELPFD